MKNEISAVVLLTVSLLQLGPASAEDRVSIQTSLSREEIIANAVFLPYSLAYCLPHLGFTRYPYESTGEAYTQGTRPVAFEFHSGALLLQGGRNAATGQFRVRGGNRLGWDIAWSSFDRDILGSVRRAGYYNGHITANYAKTQQTLIELGFGFAAFQNPDSQWGPSGELAFTFFPSSPWDMALRYQASTFSGKGYHDLAVGVGPTWRWFGFSAGYRAFFNPIHNAHGPEMIFQAWF